MIFIVFSQMSFECFNGATFQERHRHGQLFTLDSRAPHEFELVIELLEHILLLLDCSADLFVSDIVNFLLDLYDALLQFFFDECIEPLLVLLTFKFGYYIVI
jgi:hypothetical protein